LIRRGDPLPWSAGERSCSLGKARTVDSLALRRPLLKKSQREFGFSCAARTLLGLTKPPSRLRKQKEIHPLINWWIRAGRNLRPSPPITTRPMSVKTNLSLVWQEGDDPWRAESNGQGIEFDYCLRSCLFALKELGYETIMVNSNPETVSTDYDTSDKLYFEPLPSRMSSISLRSRNLTHHRPIRRADPLNLAVPLEKAGARVLEHPPRTSIGPKTGNVFRFFSRIWVSFNQNGTASSADEAVRVAREIGYPWW